MKHNKTIFLTSIVGSVFFILFQFLFPSMLNGYQGVFFEGIAAAKQGSVFVAEVINYHELHPAFIRRPLTTWIVRGLSGLLSISAVVSFVIFQAATMCGILYVLGIFAQKYRASIIQTQLIFLSSFSILFAFFSPIFTYDDLLQYLFFFMALYLYQEKKWLLGAVSLFVSFAARETGVLLIPGLVLYLGTFERKFLTKWVHDPVIVSIGFVTVAFFVLREFLTSEVVKESLIAYETSERLAHYMYNFGSKIFTVETILSGLIVLVPGLLLLVRAYQNNLFEHKKIISACVLSVIINTPIILIATRAQEARLFALPFLFLWPIAGLWMQKLTKMIYIRLQQKQIPFVSVSAFVTSFVVLFFIYTVWFVYEPTHAQAWHIGYQMYMSVFAIICGFGWILTRPGITTK